MLEANRRWAYYYDLNLESYPADAPAFEMEDVLQKVKAYWSNGKAVYKYRNQEVTVRIADIKFSKEYAAILIHHSDIKATDPAFSNTTTGELRVEEKEDDEGIAVGCHIIIRRTSLPGNKSRYLTMIEEVTGVPKSIIVQFLTAVLRGCCQKTFSTSANSKKKYSSRPRVKLEGHGSSTLKESLEKGALQNITLVEKGTGEYFDDNQELLVTGKQLSLKVTGGPIGDAALNIIANALKLGKKEYHHVRVVYSEVVDKKKKKMPDGKVKSIEKKKQRTVDFETRNRKFADSLFTKSESIKLTDEIGQCEKVIHPELSRKMKKLMNDAIK